MFGIGLIELLLLGSCLVVPAIIIVIVAIVVRSGRSKEVPPETPQLPKLRAAGITRSNELPRLGNVVLRLNPAIVRKALFRTEPLYGAPGAGEVA